MFSRLEITKTKFQHKEVWNMKKHTVWNMKKFKSSSNLSHWLVSNFGKVNRHSWLQFSLSFKGNNNYLFLVDINKMCAYAV